MWGVVGFFVFFDVFFLMCGCKWLQVQALAKWLAKLFRIDLEVVALGGWFGGLGWLMGVGFSWGGLGW